MTGSDPRDPFEDRLRETLRASDGAVDRPDLEGFLSDVHTGARSRRRRRTAALVAAAAVVVVGGAGAGSLGLLTDDPAPSADQPTLTTPATEATTRYSSEPLLHYTSDNTDVLSLTSTGDDNQWALTSTDGPECDPGACLSVFTRSVVTGAWGTPALLPIPKDADASARVSQLRYVGDASNSYDGWAFGPALLSVHGVDGRPDLWHAVDLGGPITSLEARGKTVYALVDSGTASTLMESPASTDEFQPVDAGVVGQASNLVATAGVVAILDKSDAGTEVLSSPADPETGRATGDWTRSQPCESGSEPVSLSSASDTVWALCASDKYDTVSFGVGGSDRWSSIPGYRTGLGSTLTARSTDSAVMHLADNTALMLVTADGADSLTQGSPGFSDPTMLGFTNPDLGFAIADGVLWRSVDGGVIWAHEPVL